MCIVEEALQSAKHSGDIQMELIELIPRYFRLIFPLPQQEHIYKSSRVQANETQIIEETRDEWKVITGRISI